MTARIIAAAVAATTLLILPVAAAAQSSAAMPTLTAAVGRADFVDDWFIAHGVFGGGLEWLPTRHLSVGPEVVYMIGPDDDRDLLVLGVARIGILPLRARVSPFVTAGAGLMTHSNRFANQSFRSTEGAVIVGGGVRINATPRVFIAPEVLIGWEPHLRYSVTVGLRLP